MDLVGAALEAVDPARAVRRNLWLENEVLHVAGRRYDLDRVERLVVVGAGKAGAGMAVAAEEILGARITTGWVNVRYGYESLLPLRHVHIHPANHPLPDQAGLEGTRQILALLRELGEKDLALVLISGGASALLVQPVSGVTLADLQALTEALLHSGATIQEINSVRKHLSAVKGGQLARATFAPVAVLVLSDVVGSPLDAIGSGPCAPDPTTFADAQAVLERYNLWAEIAPQARDYLERGLRGKAPETPKAADPLFERVQHVIVADNRTAALAVVERARALGLQALLLSTYLEGEAREVGRVLAALAKEEARYGEPLPRPTALILGGETTVTVRGDGLGGRNQELALSAAIALDGWEKVLLAALATDGTDGPTDAAGAIVTGETVTRAHVLGLEPSSYLARNDAYHFFDALGDLIRTGPTGTNVNDLAFVVVF
jgi:hydroxypyruvate reductase